MTQRYRKGVSFYLVDAVREALEARAESESRTVSKMGEILLTQALGVGATPEAASSAGMASRPRGRSSSARQKPAAPPARTTACEHRIGPDAYCPRCDPA